MSRADKDATREAGALETVAPGTWVTLAYHVYDAEDALVESSDVSGCVEVLFGYGQLSPRLEAALDGCRVGEARAVVLPPEEAFGHRDREAILEVDRADFPPDVREGDEFEAEREDGEVVTLRVVAVGDDVVVIDTNHPLADQDVRVEAMLEGLRLASTAELAAAEARLERGEIWMPLVPAARLVRKPQ